MIHLLHLVMIHTPVNMSCCLV